MKNLNMLCLIIVGIILGFGHINGLFFTETPYGERVVDMKYLWPVAAYAASAALVLCFRCIASDGESEKK